MELNLYQVDAFTDKLFAGNPAAIVPITDWLDDKILHSIAIENNLSETAFIKKNGAKYHIRWFSPAIEIDLCGHATLASAFVIFNYLEKDLSEITFESKSGPLYVSKDQERIILDFPSRKGKPVEANSLLFEGLGKAAKEVYLSRDYLVVYEDEEDIYNMEPDFSILKKVGIHGIIVTAPSKKYDFVSRFFALEAGIPEDPVTGSAHSTLIPYWSERLSKKELTAFQASKRGGILFCEDKGERVKIGGNAVLYMIGKIFI